MTKILHKKLKKEEERTGKEEKRYNIDLVVSENINSSVECL